MRVLLLLVVLWLVASYQHSNGFNSCVAGVDQAAESDGVFIVDGQSRWVVHREAIGPKIGAKRAGTGPN